MGIFWYDVNIIIKVISSAWPIYDKAKYVFSFHADREMPGAPGYKRKDSVDFQASSTVRFWSC